MFINDAFGCEARGISFFIPSRSSGLMPLSPRHSCSISAKKGHYLREIVALCAADRTIRRKLP